MIGILERVRVSFLLLSCVLYLAPAKAATAGGCPSDWVFENPIPTGNSLFAISFLNEDVAVTAGSAGTVMRTTNGGQSWVALRCGADGADEFDRVELLAIDYIDSSNIVAVGMSWHDGPTPHGLITKTTDGGETWLSQLAEPSLVLTGVHFSDSESGVVVGTDSSTFSPVILKTVDGGDTWDRVTSGVPALGILEGLSFADMNAGSAVGLGVDGELILRTSDGGATWEQQTGVPGWDGQLLAIYLLDSTTAWAVGGDGTIIHTTDGGVSWDSQTSGASGWISDVAFTDDLHGIAVSQDDDFLQTHDGGLTWAPIELPLAIEREDITFENVSFLGDTGMAVGRQGAILKTTDGGETWLSQTHSLVPFTVGRFDAVDFVNSNIGITVGGTVGWTPSENIASAPTALTIDPKGTILKTTDGGHTWNAKESGMAHHLRGISFVDAETVTVVGGLAAPVPDLSIGAILRSTDGGETWVPQQMPETSLPRSALVDVTCIDTWTCTAVGLTSSGSQLNGLIIRTEDGGSTWIVVVDEFGLGTVNGVSFADTSTGVSVTRLGKILRTTDGGSSWAQLSTDAEAGPLRDVSFIGNTGWAVGGEDSGTVLKTEDAGATWVVLEDGLPEGLNSVSFNDMANGTVAGVEGRIFRTTDGGMSWTPDPSGTSNGLLGIERTTEGTEVAVGQYSTILRRLGDGAELAVVPNPLDFGSVVVGGSSGTSLILTSIGTQEVTIDEISNPEAPFAFAGGTCDAPPFTLSPGESCALDFVFSPTVTGPAETTVVVAGNAAGGPRTVTLRGTGTSSLIVSPDPLDFGEVYVGETGGPQSVTLTNVGAVDMLVSDVSDPGAPFVIVGGSCGVPPFTLTSGASCTLDYTFSPTAEGSATSEVMVASDTPSSPDMFTLQGIALPPRALVGVAPQGFDVTLEAGQTTTESLDVSNAGGASLIWSIQTAELPVAAIAYPAGDPSSRAKISPSHQALDGQEIGAAVDLTSVLGEPLPGVRPINQTRSVVVDCDNAPGLILHDDGTVENAYSGNPSVISEVIFVDRFTPGAYPASFSEVCVALVSQGPTSLDFEIVVFDDDGLEGRPGTEIGTLPVSADGLPTVPPTPVWLSIDIASLGLMIDSGSVYIGVRYAPSNPNVFVSADESSDRPVGFAGGYWWNDNGGVWAPIEMGFEDYRSLLVRAVEIPAGCDDPTTLSWLHVSPNAGNTPPGGSTTVEVTVDTAGLAVGTYSANLCISSNDPIHPLVGVPVDLTVLGSDLTFDPQSADFGKVEAGATSPPEVAMLHSVGALDATGLEFQLLGNDFDIDTNACGTTLPIGGQCEVSITFTPSGVGPSAAVLEVHSDDGAIATVELSGMGVSETEIFMPMGLEVDPEPIISDANGVFEPGELAMVAPAWQNGGMFAQILEGTASNLTGPEGPIYSLLAPNADYGEVEPGQVSSCQATELCYEMDIGPVGVPRPAPHWDATFDEALSDETTHTWSLHLGDSFLDVPRASPFYAAVETLLHSGVTGGCTDFGYCPTGPNTRAQMPVFVLKALEGADYVPPACEADTQVFADVPHTSLFCPWIEELANRNLIAGCGGDNYCPNVPVTRAQMAIFLLKTLEGDGYEPPECSGEFTDVTCPSLFAAWIEELADRNVTAGCSVDPPAYCPAAPVTRQQMAVFITKTFGLDLYGP